MPITPARYIESFDSVRFAPDENIPGRREPRQAQAELELMLTMLFGERMVLSEAQSFDSLQFLETAVTVLEARRKIHTVKLNKTPVKRPFDLALRSGQPFSDYRSLVAARLEQHDPIKKQPTFVLSALSEISSDLKARRSLAEHVRAGNYQEATDSLDGTLADRLSLLEELDGYFGKRSIQARDASASLRERVYALTKLDLSHLEAQGPYLRSIASTLEDLEQTHGVRFDNRSSIRVDAGDLRQRGILGDNEYQFLAEYIDSAYNRVIAESVGASVGMFSTKGSAADIDFVLAEEASDLVNRYLTVAEPNQQGREVRGESPTQLALHIDPSTLATGELVKLAKIPWEKIWEVVTDDEWIRSNNQLHSAIERNRNWTEELHKHVELLADRLAPLVLRLDRGNVQVLIGKAGRIVGGTVGAGIGAALSYSYGTDPTGLVLGVSAGELVGTGIGFVAQAAIDQTKEQSARRATSASLMNSIRIAPRSP